MRVLWISNILFDDIADSVGAKHSVGGGWMQALLVQLKPYIEIGVVSIYAKVLSREINSVHYYLLPDVNKTVWQNVLTEFKPDLIHIHGTEYPHTFKIKQYSGDIPCVVSIQGLVGIYAKYTLGGMRMKDIFQYLTMKDFLLHSSSLAIQRSQEKRGVFERKLIANLDYIIGRTEWDYSHALAINPSIKYYKCNEAIRDTFYQGHWSISKAVPYTIFCSNSNVALKGIHQVIKAMALVRHYFPNVKMRIAGKNILGHLSLRNRLRMSGYDNYLRALIYKLKLEENVVFLGALTAEKMKHEFLSANVFVLPSAIENSPNSLAEAQLLGTPVVASYVGGIPDMMPYPLSEYLYRFTEVEMLAQKIVKVFQRKEWESYTNVIRRVSRERHDRMQIREDMIAIYQDILKRKSQR